MRGADGTVSRTNVNKMDFADIEAANNQQDVFKMFRRKAKMPAMLKLESLDFHGVEVILPHPTTESSQRMLSKPTPNPILITENAQKQQELEMVFKNTYDSHRQIRQSKTLYESFMRKKPTKQQIVKYPSHVQLLNRDYLDYYFAPKGVVGLREATVQPVSQHRSQSEPGIEEFDGPEEMDEKSITDPGDDIENQDSVRMPNNENSVADPSVHQSSRKKRHSSRRVILNEPPQKRHTIHYHKRPIQAEEDSEAPPNGMVNYSKVPSKGEQIVTLLFNPPKSPPQPTKPEKYSSYWMSRIEMYLGTADDRYLHDPEVNIGYYSQKEYAKPSTAHFNEAIEKAREGSHCV